MTKRNLGSYERWTIGLLTLQGIPVLGWLVGVVLLWTSSSWTWREKLTGTLILPGGLYLLVITPGVFSSIETCYKEPGTVVQCSSTGGNDDLIVISMAIIVIAQFWSMRRLYRTARNNQEV